MKKHVLHLNPPEGSACAEFAGVLKHFAGIRGKKFLTLEKGVYSFCKDDSVEMVLPVSNTVDREDSQRKHIGLVLENIDDLTVEGNGAKLLMCGDMSAIVIKNCRNVHLKDLTVDYRRPGSPK